MSWHGAREMVGSMYAIADSMLIMLLEHLVIVDLHYLHRFPNTISCRESAAWRAPRKVAEDPDPWCDIGSILKESAANSQSFTAWRAAEMIQAGGLVRLLIRQEEPSFAIQMGVEFVTISTTAKTPNKIRRRVQRLFARARRGEVFAKIAPGISTLTEWS